MEDRLRSMVLAAIAPWRIPGLSVAVAAPPDFRWAQGFGLADVENQVPATPETVYRLASISKPITATAVLQLAERGRLDIDAPVQDYVPAFPVKPWPVTARLLLSHLGGIRDGSEAEARNVTHYPYGSRPLSDFLEPIKHEPLMYEPGTTFRYTTHGYNLLGCAIEGASGTDYLSYVRENVFRPAGIEHIRPDDVRAIVPHRGRGYVRDGESGGLRNADFADTSDHLPGGGFAGPVSDVLRFGLALGAGALIGPDTLARMLTRQRTKDGRDIRFGLGWFVWTHNGGIEAAHGGKHYGTSTMLYVRPYDGIVVALLANLQDVSSPFLHGLARRIGDALSA